MPTPEQIVSHDAAPPPPGASPWVQGAAPQVGISIADPDPAWTEWYAVLADRVRGALGWRVLALDHVGSTSVPGLPAKPIVDVDLVVADPADEAAYVPALEAAGFVLRVREPWWWEHRLLRHEQPCCNLHVFGPDAPEPWRNRLFRDWLAGNPDDLALYRETKLAAAEAANAAGEHVMEYNARKARVIREIYDRAFRAAGLLSG
ncbi:GrpB family protein [Nocardioides sp. TF02-7]|uniref:GrpB family protein n=1 Tax=Nocardioides sp. TF02-7 TaxID=2917724 RepID=UPI001F05B1FA|nr:GrpB family protein [Nocardioides sp. TF02-7]UMG93774.1 GrpB family protein [Nocardioides sp. TF02-7]